MLTVGPYFLDVGAFLIYLCSDEFLFPFAGLLWLCLLTVWCGRASKCALASLSSLR